MKCPFCGHADTTEFEAALRYHLGRVEDHAPGDGLRHAAGSLEHIGQSGFAEIGSGRMAEASGTRDADHHAGLAAALRGFGDVLPNRQRLGGLVDRAQSPARIGGSDALRQGIEGIEHGGAWHCN